MAGWSLARWLGDDGAGEFDQGTVAFNFALPAGAKTAKAIVPTVGPLDYPAPRLAANVADERRLRYPCLRILLTICSRRDASSSIEQQVSCLHRTVAKSPPQRTFVQCRRFG